MAIRCVEPAEIIQLPLRKSLPKAKTMTLVATTRLKVMRIIVLAGETTRTYQAPGEATLQCLEGCVRITAGGKVQDLSAGEMMYMPSAEPHSLRASEDSSLLLTIALDATQEEPQKDVVQQASEESFPASMVKTPTISVELPLRSRGTRAYCEL